MGIICIISDYFVLLILFTITLKDFSKRLLSHFPRASLDFRHRHLDYHIRKFPLPSYKSSQPNVKSYSDQNVTG